MNCWVLFIGAATLVVVGFGLNSNSITPVFVVDGMMLMWIGMAVWAAKKGDR
jgi:hypothetical protein